MYTTTQHPGTAGSVHSGGGGGGGYSFNGSTANTHGQQHPSAYQTGGAADHSGLAGLAAAANASPSAGGNASGTHTAGTTTTTSTGHYNPSLSSIYGVTSAARMGFPSSSTSHSLYSQQQQQSHHSHYGSHHSHHSSGGADQQAYATNPPPYYPGPPPSAAPYGTGYYQPNSYGTAGLGNAGYNSAYAPPQQQQAAAAAAAYTNYRTTSSGLFASPSGSSTGGAGAGGSAGMGGYADLLSGNQPYSTAAADPHSAAAAAAAAVVGMPYGGNHAASGEVDPYGASMVMGAPPPPPAAAAPDGSTAAASAPPAKTRRKGTKGSKATNGETAAAASGGKGKRKNAVPTVIAAAELERAAAEQIMLRKGTKANPAIPYAHSAKRRKLLAQGGAAGAAAAAGDEDGGTASPGSAAGSGKSGRGRKSAASAGGDEEGGKQTGTVTMFQCTGFGNCNMVFTRSEHLARHVRKHTGERPFRCHCLKSFSRLDNLRQHAQTVHADTPERNEEMMQDLVNLHASLAASAAQVQYAHQQVLGKANPADVPINQGTRKARGGSVKGARKKDSALQMQHTDNPAAVVNMHPAAGVDSLQPPPPPPPAHAGFGEDPHAMLNGAGGVDGTAPHAANTTTPSPAALRFAAASKVIPRSNSMSEVSLAAHAFPSMPPARGGPGGANSLSGPSGYGGPTGFGPAGHFAGSFDPLQHRHSIANHHIPTSTVSSRPHYDTTAPSSAGDFYQTGPTTTGVPHDTYDVNGAAYHSDAAAPGDASNPMYFPYEGAGNPATDPATGIAVGSVDGTGAPPEQQYDPQSGFPMGDPAAAAAAAAAGVPDATEYDIYGNPTSTHQAGHAGDAMYGNMGLYGSGQRPGTSGNGYHANGTAGAAGPGTAWQDDQWRRDQDAYAGYAGYPGSNMPFGTTSNGAQQDGRFGGVGGPGSPYATRPNSSHGATRPGSPTDRPILPPLSSLSRPGTAGGSGGRLPPNGFGGTGTTPAGSRLPSRSGSRGDALALDAGSTSLASYGTTGKSPAFGSGPFGSSSRSGLPSLSGLIGGGENRTSRRNSLADPLFASTNSTRNNSPEPPPFQFAPPPLGSEATSRGRRSSQQQGDMGSRPSSRRVSIVELLAPTNEASTGADQQISKEEEEEKDELRDDEDDTEAKQNGDAAVQEPSSEVPEEREAAVGTNDEGEDKKASAAESSQAQEDDDKDVDDALPAVKP